MFGGAQGRDSRPRARMSLEREQQLRLDGIDTCLAMAPVAYSRPRAAVLWHSEARVRGEAACDTNKLVVLDAWSLIDITHKLRVLVRRTRGLTPVDLLATQEAQRPAYARW